MLVINMFVFNKIIYEFVFDILILDYSFRINKGINIFILSYDFGEEQIMNYK